ncbi:UDP-N-acetylmuramoyl-tripeptide--D-alanyl-D-alanine ligase [Marinihelvus fidelis]|uniref:UDP-N-acetylmuramoyl-tripeptide--D-alanyl-D-alanine ligase n=2 Tax=Marinihelvus fidelis TaxID=2613842 RepID=A0A5N0T3X4_9GAMM|nr:UDP-N-acetylmuramoyl-tripeptide--D-alanyl-D-alanine ligase [Marinihelvus fidelis]
MTLHDAARALGIEPTGAMAETTFEGVVIDSRQVAPGMLFAAIPGERVDGHDFVAAAKVAGACAALVERDPGEQAAGLPLLRVDSVQTALGQLASAWRDTVTPKVAAITGSNGKTTTKEMLTSILSRQSHVLATRGNFNNELGLPLTLFRLARSHQFAVLEMGAGKAGDIRYLAGIAKPDVGVITNVGPAHLRGFGDEEGVARAKGEMYGALPASGFAVLNIDEPWAPLWRELNTAGHTLCFGRDADAADITVTGEPGGRRMVRTPAGEFRLSLHLPGEHNVMNALAATAMALALDIPLDTIREGLAATLPVPGRLNMVETESGWTVLDDTYNANPASLYAALQVLAGQAGEPWLVLGDMKELGRNSDALHAEMGEAAASLGVRRLYALGGHAAHAARGFGDGGQAFDSLEALLEALLADLHAGVSVLVKGSRGMAMERVVEAVTRRAECC